MFQEAGSNPYTERHVRFYVFSTSYRRVLGYLKLDHNRFLFCSPFTSFDAKSFLNGVGYVTNPTSLHPRLSTGYAVWKKGLSGHEVWLGAAHTRCLFVYTMARSIIRPPALSVNCGDEVRDKLRRFKKQRLSD